MCVYVMCVRACVCMCMCVRACVCTCLCVYVHVCVRACVSLHTQLAWFTLRCLHVHTHGHTGEVPQPTRGKCYVCTYCSSPDKPFKDNPTTKGLCSHVCGVECLRPQTVFCTYFICATVVGNSNMVFFNSLLTTYMRMFCIRRLLLCFFFWKHYSKRSIAGNAVVA